MNKLPVYLYSNKLNVILDLDQNKGIYKIMYQRKLKIQKGFKDSIQIQFKNSDQKAVSINSGTYWFDMIDASGRELVLSKQLSVLDDSVTTSTKGLALASFDPIDTINLTAASYKFIVKQDNGDGTFTPSWFRYRQSFQTRHTALRIQQTATCGSFPLGVSFWSPQVGKKSATKAVCTAASILNCLVG